MMGVIASQPDGEWVTEQLNNYSDRHFIIQGIMDLTTNVKFISDDMQKKGFIPNGKEQDYKDLHIFPVDYFCPRLTTGEYCRTSMTYCESVGGKSSWAKSSVKRQLLNLFPQKIRTELILLKRRIFG